MGIQPNQQLNSRFNVVLVGLGPMGRLIADLLISRDNIHLLGVVDIDPRLKDKQMRDILPSSTSSLPISMDLQFVLESNNVDVVIIATSSSLEKVAPTIKTAIESGCNVLSICEELSFPYSNSPDLSSELDVLAKKNNVSIVGTGINPGYLMDLLPIVLSAPCQVVNKISVTRMMNSSKRREPFQRKIGTGLSIEEFQKKIANKEITGHVGLIQSIQMIIAALGLKHGEIIEKIPEPILCEDEFVTSYGSTIKEGFVRGLRSIGVAKSSESDDNLVVLDFIAFAGDHEEYDQIKIEGIPSIEQKIIGGVHGDLGTAAMVANLIPNVYSTQPGLYTMKDIAVPCNTSNIWKK